MDMTKMMIDAYMKPLYDMNPSGKLLADIQAFEKELYALLEELNKQMAIIVVSHDVGTITSLVKNVVCVNRTVHRHATAELTAELLENYHCPIQIISHGNIPHTVLGEHEHCPHCEKGE